MKLVKILFFGWNDVFVGIGMVKVVWNIWNRVILIIFF